jgi:transcriptional regulator with XRE-family HTH domain
MENRSKYKVIRLPESLMNRQEREQLSTFLKELRGGKTQRSFADILNCSYSALRSWEEAESVPGIENLQKIAEIAEISIYELIAIIKQENLAEKKETIESLKRSINSLNREEKLEIARFIMNLI